MNQSERERERDRERRRDRERKREREKGWKGEKRERGKKKDPGPIRPVTRQPVEQSVDHFRGFELRKDDDGGERRDYRGGTRSFATLRHPRAPIESFLAAGDLKVSLRFAFLLSSILFFPRGEPAG